MVLMLVGVCWLLAVLLIVCLCLTASERAGQRAQATEAELGEPARLVGMGTIPDAAHEPRAPHEPQPASEHRPATLVQSVS